MSRLPDKLRIEVEESTGGSASFDNFTTFSVTNDITSPSEAAFETGDDGTWEAIQDKVKPGTLYKVFINDKKFLTGRVEYNDIPIDPNSGAEVRYTIRTKLADASYAAADPKVRVVKTTIRDFIYELYAPLGYTSSDFIFMAHAARDLITGKDTSGQDDPLEVDLEKMKEDQARIAPPETIFQAADRHLRRFGLMHWDSPDGKIVIGAPNDKQDPIYHLRANRGTQGAQNNIIRATRTMDWSGIPSVIGVFGKAGKRGSVYTRIGKTTFDSDVYNAGFYRPVMILAEGLRSEVLAEHAVARELSARSRNKDAWQIEIDGLSYWDGQQSINWGPDTVAAIESNVAGLSGGAYYIHRTVLSRDASSGDKANLTMLARGIWRL